ncbi:MAG TPA: hypothetical protein VMY05_00525 [Acidobacteriota bacterium]|nr:hypothetical protein [Acidobacteriota bacterium]
MFCAQCLERITGKPIRQGGEYFCSLECANLASGIDVEEESEGYYEEEPIAGLYEEEE